MLPPAFIICAFSRRDCLLLPGILPLAVTLPCRKGISESGDPLPPHFRDPYLQPSRYIRVQLLQARGELPCRLDFPKVEA